MMLGTFTFFYLYFTLNLLFSFYIYVLAFLRYFDSTLIQKHCFTTTGSFLIMYIILTLYGTYTIYKDVSSTGCDPSAGVQTNTTCKSSGPAVFGAMLGT
jgi:hypothetical protein